MGDNPVAAPFFSGRKSVGEGLVPSQKLLCLQMYTWAGTSPTPTNRVKETPTLSGLLSASSSGRKIKQLTPGERNDILRTELM